MGWIFVWLLARFCCQFCRSPSFGLHSLSCVHLLFIFLIYFLLYRLNNAFLNWFPWRRRYFCVLFAHLCGRLSLTHLRDVLILVERIIGMRIELKSIVGRVFVGQKTRKVNSFSWWSLIKFLYFLIQVRKVWLFLNFIKLNRKSFTRSECRLFPVKRSQIKGIDILVIGKVVRREHGRRSFSKLIFLVGRIGIGETLVTGSVGIETLCESATFGGNDRTKLKLIVVGSLFVVGLIQLNAVLHWV